MTEFNDATIDRLIESNDRVAESSNQLALATVEYQERSKTARKRFRVTVYIITVFCSVMLVGILVLGVIMLRNLHSAQDGRNQIRDCVLPTGKCFQDNQKRSEALLAQVGRQEAALAVCAIDNAQLPLAQRFGAVQTCAAKLLKSGN